jgi:hypothetical protein
LIQSEIINLSDKEVEKILSINNINPIRRAETISIDEYITNDEKRRQNKCL